MPDTEEGFVRALGLNAEVPSWDELTQWNILQPGTRVVDPGPVFPRIAGVEVFKDQGWGI